MDFEVQMTECVPFMYTSVLRIVKEPKSRLIVAPIAPSGRCPRNGFDSPIRSEPSYDAAIIEARHG
jgi:hypothetical protein